MSGWIEDVVECVKFCNSCLHKLHKTTTMLFNCSRKVSASITKGVKECEALLAV